MRIDGTNLELEIEDRGHLAEYERGLRRKEGGSGGEGLYVLMVSYTKPQRARCQIRADDSDRFRLLNEPVQL